MARTFDGIDDNVNVNSTPVTAAAFTMCADFFTADTTNAQTMAFIGDKDVGNHFWALLADGATGGDPIIAAIDQGGTQTFPQTTTGYSANTWHRACLKEVSATSHAVFIDGGSKGTTADNVAPAGADRVSAGIRNRSSPDLPFAGRIANVTIWNIALSDAEIAILGGPRGMHPLRMRPANIVLFWPLGVASPEPDWSGGARNGTVTEATIGDNPPSMLPFGFDASYSPVSAAVAAAYLQKQMLLGVGL